MNRELQLIHDEITKVIQGKDEIVTKVIMAILARGNVLLEDVPGVGKTTMALAFARTMGLHTRRVQFTPDTMPSDIIGFSVYDKETGKLVYKKGAIMTNLFLADEINRTSSKTQAALLEAMEEKKVTVDGVTYRLPEPFIVLATENPVGSAGTQMLPNSQLDRFMIKLSIGYPDLESQINILADRRTENPLDNVRSITNRDVLKNLSDATAEVEIVRSVYRYIAEIVQATREHEMITLGISPRGALALSRMSQAHALINDRTYVTPDDVKAVAKDVLAHRLMLNAKARLNDYTAEMILEEIIKEIRVGRVEDMVFLEKK